MKIYLSGIGGVGIGPLAEIALDAGYKVVGSDKNESLMTKYLQDKGVEMSIGLQDGYFLSTEHTKLPIDMFVYTSALPDNHPELVMAQNLGIKTAKRDELLAQIINEKNLKLIAIAGTHGKTTTTGMALWAFMQLNIPVSYSIGSTISFGTSGRYDPNSEYFVYECDEFDHNFLNFKPYLSLVTTVDYDHPDSYPNEQSYLDAFRQFANQSKQVITWDDQHPELYLDNPNTIILNDSDEASINLYGKHNRKNATLVIKAFEQLGISQPILNVLETFPGTNRRFEKLAEGLFSDYGHHPVEIKATLELASEISKNIVLVYQPHQNLRQHHLKENYTDQFESAETVYWLPTYLSREDESIPIVSFEELTKNISNKDAIMQADINDELWQKIEQARKDNKLVICMGAGSIDSWLRARLA